jgi:flagellar hook-associated protein 1 FlgK
MSISSSLSNALSGLTAASRAAEIVSSNTANAMTAGYARRELSLSARSLGGDGGGVWVDGINRILNLSVLADKRIAAADSASASILHDFFAQMEAALGEPGANGALSTSLSKVETALIEAASRPDSEARLATVLQSAKSLVNQINELSASLQSTRTGADQQIGVQVGALNSALSQIDRLNTEILSQRASGRDPSALLDQRQVLVDQISSIVPLREVMREHGQISLFTTGGAILLDGKPAVFGFTPVGLVTADMTVDPGVLSGLTMNGMAIPLGDQGMVDGGTLGALFALRDRVAPQAQSQIDAFARDLIERFENTAIDPTLAPGAPGLFTDRGFALDVGTEVGLAGRLSVNALADPAQGGALWRLRDGLGAAAPGLVGDTRLLNALAQALTDPRAPSSGAFIGAARSAFGLAADILSQFSSARQTAETQQGYTNARLGALTDLHLADGVDTDHEMQMLLRIEQAYAANARVIQTIDKLLQQILAL